MKKIEITLYEFSELSDKAKQRALDEFRETNDSASYQLQSHLINLLKEELEDRKIEYDTDSIDVRYSLSYSQGDGLMFLGKLKWAGEDVTITHAGGHYYHSRSRDIDAPTLSEREYEDFSQVYQSICKKMEKIGYDEIEYQNSEEHFAEMCEANEWTFEENGTMRNQ